MASLEAPNRSAASICRRRRGPNSHFYGRPADCDPSAPPATRVFEYEGEDFAVAIPVNGVPQLNAVYGLPLFNNRSAQNDGNPSLTVAGARYNEMTGKGWGAGRGPCSARPAHRWTE